MAELISTVILIAGTKDLVEHLEQVLIVLMDAEQGRIIGFEAVLQKFFEAKDMEEFL